MHASELYAPSLDNLLDHCIERAKAQAGFSKEPTVVVSPYRFNPLGAHIDHQGGSVLARCLNQYTVLCFWPSNDSTCTIRSNIAGSWQVCSFAPAELEHSHGWDAMSRASATAFDRHAGLVLGINAVVSGTLVSGGLSSSASVILAYLSAFAHVNDVKLDPVELVELCRQVENDYRGLNNGIQDQMSIAFARRGHLALLDVESVSATMIADPPGVEKVQFLMCYSGVSRDLAGSGFNTRVAECQQAASLLSPDALYLGQVARALREEAQLNKLPDLLQRRARHVYSEMARVDAGVNAWQNGDWETFGQLMSVSCQSSIHDYQSGSEWLIALHEIASDIKGVYGNRFSGGGYGGCLFLLVDASQIRDVAEQLMDRYLSLYPDRSTLARIQIAQSEGTVRIVN